MERDLRRIKLQAKILEQTICLNDLIKEKTKANDHLLDHNDVAPMIILNADLEKFMKAFTKFWNKYDTTNQTRS